MRRRNMYYATGLPGWMRFGHSPGWVARSPSGLGPCAQYLTTGQWPTPAMASAAQGMPIVQAPTADKQQQLAFLQAQAEMLEQQLEALRSQLQTIEEQE